MNRQPTRMEEQICRALCKVNRVDPDTIGPVQVQRDGMTLIKTDLTPAWVMFLDDVVVMFDELREPTPEMFAAYMGALENPADQRRAAYHKMKMLKRWSAIINAASPP